MTIRICGLSIWPRITPSPSVGEVGAVQIAAHHVHALDDTAEDGEAELIAARMRPGVEARHRADR